MIDGERRLFACCARGSRKTQPGALCVPPALVERAKRIFDARTETEAIIRSLEEHVFMQQVERAVRATAGKLPDLKPIR